MEPTTVVSVTTGMFILTLAVALPSPKLSDGDRYDSIASAADAVRSTLEAKGCVQPRGYRERAIARLSMAEELPWPVVELSYSRVLPLFDSDECTRQALALPEGVTAYRVPEVPACARSAAADEIEVAGWLADRGFGEAADAVAELANRWDRTRCPRKGPRSRVEARESEEARWCSCGGRKVRAEELWLGYGPSADELRFELDLVRRGECADREPFGACPVGCVATDTYRPERRSRGLGGIHTAMLEVDERAVEVVHQSGAGISKPVLHDILTQLPVGCHGTVEWLGEWVPYDDHSRCLVEAMRPMTWRPRAWVVLDT